MYWLLFAAIAAGFFLGRFSRQSPVLTLHKTTQSIDPDYIRGLNHLLNEDADAAVDTFTELLPVNAKTLETHLALGALLRRRGEVGRAIRVHQHLVDHRELSRLERQRAQLELGLDYLKAGVLDRAEALFEGLHNCPDEKVVVQSLGYLAEIYRDEKEWLKAATVIDRMLDSRAVVNQARWRAMQSHFYCEQSQLALNGGDTSSARKYLARASIADGHCVRVSLLLANLELSQKHYRSAIRYLKRVPEQDPDYIPEILPGLLESYQGLDAVAELIDYLKNLQDTYPSSSVLISLAEQVKQHESESAAVALLNQKIHTRPSLRVVGKFLDFHWSKRTRDESDKEQTLVRSLFELLLLHKSYYRCESCGFSGNQLHWQCPSCKSWGTIKAVKGLEGE